MDLVVVLAVLLCFSGVCYMLLGARLIGGKRDPGNLPIGLSAFIVGLWVLGGALEMLASSYVVFSIGPAGCVARRGRLRWRFSGQAFHRHSPVTVERPSIRPCVIATTASVSTGQSNGCHQPIGKTASGWRSRWIRFSVRFTK